MKVFSLTTEEPVVNYDEPVGNDALFLKVEPAIVGDWSKIYAKLTGTNKYPNYIRGDEKHIKANFLIRALTTMLISGLNINSSKAMKKWFTCNQFVRLHNGIVIEPVICNVVPDSVNTQLNKVPESYTPNDDEKVIEDFGVMGKISVPVDALRLAQSTTHSYGEWDAFTAHDRYRFVMQFAEVEKKDRTNVITALRKELDSTHRARIQQATAEDEKSDFWRGIWHIYEGQMDSAKKDMEFYFNQNRVMDVLSRNTLENTNVT